MYMNNLLENSTSRLAIGYVHGGHSVHPAFMQSVQSFIFVDWGQGGHHVLSQILSSGGLYVDHNRNSLTYLFLRYEPKIDWLLMVDTDIAFQSIDVYAMLDAAHPVERPVISGLYFSNFTEQKLGVQPLWYNAEESWKAFSHFNKPINMNGHVLHPIDACGAGYMLVHRSVFERIAELHPDEHYKWFKHIEVDPDTVPMGEDLTFCARIHEAGFPIYGLGVVVTHCKTLGLDAMSFIKDHPNYVSYVEPNEEGIEKLVTLKQVA